MCDLGAAPPPARAEYCGEAPESSCRPLSPSAGQMWSQQLGPHLQRNKQLQDILLQREEELFQLQEENQKLREFLNSSFVRNLQAQKVSGDGRGGLPRQLKRNLAGPDEGPLQNSPWPPQISKRVCRNITAEFSSESESPPEPNLDRWVLRMLGLKDVGAVDPSPTSSWSWSSKDSSRTSTHHNSLANGCVSSGPCPDLGQEPSGPSSLYEDSKDMTRPSLLSTAFQSPPEEPDFRWPTAGPACSWSSAGPAAGNHSSPSRSSPDGNHSSPPAEDVLVSPSPSSSLVRNKQQRCAGPGRPSGRCWTPADPPADVVFSMCLSPSSSIRTHSFPQGQAFIRNNPDGRWSFTWVPRHGP
ncbi:geminin coiled-coil domain-containing protein 1 isoform X1 [Takifugu rubripes]|uniref:Geminin coiled-coil domain containing n=2 Tax=Takifugu rubripes TaxID=31033 RepID=A0A674NNY1_TAKRU|nr:geminin coiled-coil domain-containing protein 1 isoform X1 [Takifugu rubripes]